MEFLGLIQICGRWNHQFFRNPDVPCIRAGIFLTIFSFLMVIFIIIRKEIFGDPVAGWPSLACIIIFIAGLQFLCMGIMGKYIAKTYLEVKNRPHYIVSETNKDHVDPIH